MSRREEPTVTDAIALCDFDGRTQEALRPFEQHDDDVRLLLRDIITIFDQRKVDPLRSSDLIDGLLAIDGRPWSGEYLRDAQKLARLLRPLHIRPKTLRFVDRTAKGYERRWFEKALIRVTEMAATGRWPS